VSRGALGGSFLAALLIVVVGAIAIDVHQPLTRTDAGLGVPEPNTGLIISSGLLLVGLARRKSAERG
jgi:hypothetical protein